MKPNRPSYALTVLGDETRQRIMTLLSAAPRSVSELAARLPVSRSAVSQHLAVLVSAGLIQGEKRGRERRYRSINAALVGVSELVSRWAEASSADSIGAARPQSSDEVDAAVRTIIKTWPDADPLSVAILTRIHLLSRAMRRRLETAAQRHGITAPDAILLGTLRRLGPPYISSPTQLSHQAVLSAPTMTKRLAQLRRLGLIERRGAEDDRRVSMIVLTARGAQAIDAVVNEHFLRNRDSTAALSRADLQRLADGLRTVIAGLSAGG